MRSGVLQRAASLAAILRRDPQEFVQRVSAIVAGRMEPWRHRPPAYEPVDWSALEHMLTAYLGATFSAALREPGLVAIEHNVRAAAAQLGRGSIDALHNADPLLARCCYALVRVLRPAVVVETGVAHGVTSAYLLAALDVNGHGSLHSIDLPPHDAGAQPRVGAFVPARVRDRWRLHRGMAHRVLPALVSELGRVDLFVHDSMHTFDNMSLEFASVWRCLPEHGVIVADDVQGNRAFIDLQSWQPSLWAVCAEATKPALFGVAIR